MTQERLVVRGADVLGLVPGLLGYEPSPDHVVVLGVHRDGVFHGAAGILWIAPIGEGQDSPTTWPTRSSPPAATKTTPAQ